MPQPYIFRTVELDNQSIRTAVRPGKPHLTPLLIFNGIGANLELVFPFIEALDPDTEVIAFDVPGVGGSSTPRHPYRFPGLAKLTARMLDYLDYGQVNVIGVSGAAPRPSSSPTITPSAARSWCWPPLPPVR